MKVQDLTREIEEFQAALIAHRDLFARSTDVMESDYPVENEEELRAQSQQLSRTLGRLLPFLQRFKAGWLVKQPMTGLTVDVLDVAVGMGHEVQIKGEVLQHAIDGVEQVIGRLQGLDADDEIPDDPKSPVRSGAPTDRLVLGYLDRLHPFIRQGCTQLFRNGHYAQAVEEAAKAVLEYLRKKTGSKLDGTALAEHVFGEKTPMLVFGDLTDPSVRNEQVGFMNLVKGLAQGVRNPLAHTHGKQEQAQKAFEYLVTASLFCRRIDEAQPPKAKPTP